MGIMKGSIRGSVGVLEGKSRGHKLLQGSRGKEQPPADIVLLSLDVSSSCRCKALKTTNCRPSDPTSSRTKP